MATQIAQLLTIKREREIEEGVSKRESRRKDKCAPARPWLDGGLGRRRALQRRVLCFDEQARCLTQPAIKPHLRLGWLGHSYRRSEHTSSAAGGFCAPLLLLCLPGASMACQGCSVPRGFSLMCGPGVLATVHAFSFV